jgi:pimeloyl-ACP methyl ester carboxylesterase
MTLLLPLLLSLPAAAPKPLEFAPCGNFRCATLEVPEDYLKPDGRKLELKVVVVPAVSPDPKLPPLVDFAGGPGISATGGAEFYATIGAAHRQKRDVVLMDQRGVQELPCPELVQTDPLDGVFPVDAVTRCRERLAKTHDLSQFGTANAVRDVELLRVALGAEKLDLSGISYGTRVAQHYLRAHPERVRAAVLIGTVPDDAKVPLGYAKAAQAALDEALPDSLDDEWQAILARVRAGEVTVDRNGRKVTLTPATFGEAMRNKLGTTTGLRAAPALVESLARGEFQAFADTVKADGSFSQGLYLSIACAEETGRIVDGEIDAATRDTFLGAARVEAQRAACKAWNVPVVQPPTTAFPDTPVLLLAGGADHVTPPSYAKAVAAKLPNAQIIEIPGLGHFPEGLSNMECYDAMIVAFFDDPAKKVDAACVATMR